jgi:hypothetical protein
MRHYFSEYRPNDYRTPRSMRECYGPEARLSVDKADTSDKYFWAGVMLFAACFGLLIWRIFHWL